jgi:anti-sigma factor RsiW
MMEKCYDEGTLQAFLDNELNPELSQKVARHVADCDPCAFMLAEVEEETAFAFAALEQEFNTLVPTQRLWTKINESIEIQSRNRSVWQKLSGFFGNLNLFNPQILAFGSLLLVVGVVSVLIVMKNGQTPERAKNIELTVSPVQSVAKNENRVPVITPQSDEPPVVDQSKVNVPRTKTALSYQVEKTDYVESKPNRQPIKDIVDPLPPTPQSQYLEGEESYVKTIARLEQTVNQNKDEVLKPSQRFSYEKDLAVVNDTISKLKKEVRKNPKNEDAKQILFASYQNKIELLNSVSQRGELMASLR